MAYIIGAIIIIAFLGAIIISAISAEKRSTEKRDNNDELEILNNELISYVKLHNDGRSLDDVINILKKLDIEYSPKSPV